MSTNFNNLRDYKALLFNKHLPNLHLVVFEIERLIKINHSFFF